MFTTLAETYMIAARIEPMIGRRHPESTRITMMIAEREARKARIAEMVREAETRARRDAVRRFVARMLIGLGDIFGRLGDRLTPKTECRA